MMSLARLLVIDYGTSGMAFRGRALRHDCSITSTPFTVVAIVQAKGHRCDLAL